jgi:hypothetical protein
MRLEEAMTRARWLPLTLLAIAWLSPAGVAQENTAINRLGVDVVTLADGKQVRGVVYSRQKGGGLVLAVERSWLEVSLPEFYSQQQELEKQRLEKIREQLLPRLDAWIKRREGNRQLLLYLEEQRKRLSQPAGENPRRAVEPGFIFVELASRDVRRTYVQPADRRQVAMVAWQEQLENVSGRTAASLAGELKEKEVVDIASQRVDLSFQLPPLPDDDRQWAVRVAIIEYLFGLHVSFQGSGSVLVRTDEKAALPDAGQMMAKMLEQQLSRQLADLFPRGRPAAEKPWRQEVIQVADGEQVNAARVLLLKQDMRAQRVTVESHFLARMPTGRWETVALHRQVVVVGGAQPELQARVEADPQVQKVLAVFAALGLEKNDPRIQLALRFGVATDIALQGVNKQFGEAQLPFGQQLERPPVSIHE